MTADVLKPIRLPDNAVTSEPIEVPDRPDDFDPAAREAMTERGYSVEPRIVRVMDHDRQVHEKQHGYVIRRDQGRRPEFTGSLLNWVSRVELAISPFSTERDAWQQLQQHMDREAAAKARQEAAALVRVQHVAVVVPVGVVPEPADQIHVDGLTLTGPAALGLQRLQRGLQLSGKDLTAGDVLAWLAGQLVEQAG